MISRQQDIALQGSNQRWEFSPIALKKKDPFYFENFKYFLSRVLGYVKCMESCGLKWLGLRFIFPLIWWLDRDYKCTYMMAKKDERACWGALIMRNGFLQPEEVHLTSQNFI